MSLPLRFSSLFPIFNKLWPSQIMINSYYLLDRARRCLKYIESLENFEDMYYVVTPLSRIAHGRIYEIQARHPLIMFSTSQLS